MIDPRVVKRMAAATVISMEMAVTVVLGVVAGYWLDQRLGTSPLLLLALALGALVGGSYRLVNSLGRIASNDDDPDPPRNDDDPQDADR